MEQEEYASMNILEQDHWWFKAKRHFLRLALEHNGVRASEGSLRALDVGCGTGAVLLELSELGFAAEGLDMSPLAKSFCEKKGQRVTLGEATALPFPDASFDVVTALDMIEHVDNDEQVMKELYRVVKPGGTIVVTVPAHPSLWSYHDVALHHKRRYTKKTFRSLITSVAKESRIGWIHATILPGVVLVRQYMRLFQKEKKTSDVRPVSPFISGVMSIPYFFEYGMFRLLGTLPWGVSLIATIRRPL